VAWHNAGKRNPRPDLPREKETRIRAQTKTRVEQNEIRAKIHYGSRQQKWIFERKMNGTRPHAKAYFSLKLNKITSKTQRSPPSLSHLIIGNENQFMPH
jgi:hypothetical protein